MCKNWTILCEALIKLQPMCSWFNTEDRLTATGVVQVRWPPSGAPVRLKTTMAPSQEVSVAAAKASELESIIHWKKGKDWHWRLLSMEESFSFFVKKAVRDRWSVCQVFFWKRLSFSKHLPRTTFEMVLCNKPRAAFVSFLLNHWSVGAKLS